MSTRTRGIPQVPLDPTNATSLRRFLVDVREQLIDLRGTQTSPPTSATLVVTASSGLFTSTIVPNAGAQVAVAYYLEVASSAAFTPDVTTVYTVGSTNQLQLNLGNVTRYFRARAKYPNSTYSDYFYFGTAGNPTPVVGGGGGGGVTSVGLTMPSEFSVAGSPVTGAGTLAVTKATQSANQVYAGPSSGAAAAPAFRSLVAADLPAGASGALVFLEEQTASTSAALNFTTALSTTYDDYVILFSNVVFSTASINVYLQFSSNGGTSYDTASTNYWWNRYYNGLNFNASGINGATQSTGWDLTGGGGLQCTTTSTPFNGRINLYGQTTGLVSNGDGTMFGWFDSPAHNYCLRFGFLYNSAVAQNAFRIIPSSGTITSGTVRVYGIAKA